MICLKVFFWSHLEENPATVKPPGLQQNISWNDVKWPCYYQVGCQYHPISRVKAVQLGLRTRKKGHHINKSKKYRTSWQGMGGSCFSSALGQTLWSYAVHTCTNFSARYENERRHQNLGLKRGQRQCECELSDWWWNLYFGCFFTEENLLFTSLLYLGSGTKLCWMIELQKTFLYVQKSAKKNVYNFPISHVGLA